MDTNTLFFGSIILCVIISFTLVWGIEQGSTKMCVSSGYERYNSIILTEPGYIACCKANYTNHIRQSKDICEAVKLKEVSINALE